MRIMWGASLCGFLLILGCGGGGSGQAAPLPESTERHDLGAVRGDAQTTFQLEVVKPLISAATMELLEPPTGPFAPAPNALPADTGTGVEATLKVVFSPPVNPSTSTQQGTIRLRFTSADGQVSLVKTLAFTAIIDDVSAGLPLALVEVGKVTVGTAVRFGISVENRSLATPIEVSGASVPPGDFSVAPDAGPFPLIVPPASRRSVTMVFRPSREGASEATVTIPNSASAAPLHATVRGTGIGTERTIYVGFVPVDPVTGESAWVEFNVPPEAVGLYLDASGDPVSSIIDLIGLEGPSVRVYETSAQQGPLDWRANYPAGARGYLNVQLPSTNAPSVQLVPGGGTYRFRVRDSNPVLGGLDVSVRIKQEATGSVTGGTIDLSIFLANSLRIADRNDPLSDPGLGMILKTADVLLGTIGVRIGRIEFTFLDASFDMIEDPAEIDDLLAQNTSGHPEGRLNLFFVDGTLPRSMATAGATPGPESNGSRFSGVVVGFYAADTTSVGGMVAHVIGHYLGHVGLGVENGGITFTAGEAHAILRHPLVKPGLPAEFLSKPGDPGLSEIQALLAVMPPMLDWCGTCQQPRR